MSDTIEVFISYSKQDKALRDGLLSHLRPLEAKGIISWHDRQILPGTEWDAEIKARLNAADIILLLISSDFLATDYCTRVEIPEALRRHEAGEATVMPVILRSCGWRYTPLAKIQAYPEKAEPIKSWKDIDEAYTNVVNGVYLAATKIKERRSSQAQEEQECIQQEQQPSDQTRSSPDALRGDYAHLEALMKAGKWKEADYETAKQMSDVMERQTELLRVKDIEQFPCADLRMMDQLWVKYSKGKFGFSVQKQIWQKWGSPTEYSTQWKKFGEEVGWKKKGVLGVKNDWKIFSEVIFDISAPSGHLPIGWNSVMQLGKWKKDFHNAWAYGWTTSSWEHIIRRSPSYVSSLVSRLVSCAGTERPKSQELEE
ncbi:GUN4 domain-containing protein [Leptolyngbya sp. PCC 6406]|uniref:GUN4 domain-containing protein n=1 Tax=Leptolyngbya sp. PCC 6406 TaxID=1173264 RepID=UPI0002AD098B|nr:GUN4 domain-containing protein [Leptolyngbya sp. PCC 6406]